MTAEEKFEGNMLILEFMGYYKSPYSNLPNKMYIMVNGKEFGVHIDSVDFPTSWNDLMPVCKKLDYLAENKVIEFSDDYEYWCNQLEDAVTMTYEIEPVYKCVVDFIKWYNTNNPSK